ncbi:hypothetical protein BCV69DRAFT_285519 [Microstroma glucosiphilum]|uniref:Uncharacterized protein n=1 Tax=Pseudomicrostroma glucosiphilum TaxID=1684307 RepID=A0A316TXC1_9BASI|nr:hypothetical protein BCV69DRAFT_285519 [Pseudomicrostroma glucosiphilum]PWN17927.1 hypothetical protein BCV69DRAFT_285519 [Pseudomicrostroma glucosiphilum]
MTLAMASSTDPSAEFTAPAKPVCLPGPARAVVNQRRRSRSASFILYDHLAARDWAVTAAGQINVQMSDHMTDYSASAEPQEPLAGILSPPVRGRGRRNALSIHVQPSSTTSTQVFWNEPQPFATALELRHKQKEQVYDPLEVDLCAMSLAPPPRIRRELTYGTLASLDLSTTTDRCSCGKRASYSASSATDSAISSCFSAIPSDLEVASFYSAATECPPFYNGTGQKDSIVASRSRDSKPISGTLHAFGPEAFLVHLRDRAARDEHVTGIGSLPGVDPSTGLLDSVDPQGSTEVSFSESKIRQQRNAMRDLTEELEVYLAALVERRGDCPATVGSQAFATISSLLSASRSRDNQAQQSSSSASPWTSADMERELTPESEMLNMSAACRRLSLQNPAILLPFSLMPPKQQMLLAGMSSVAEQRRRSCTGALASWDDLQDARQPMDKLFSQRQVREERCDVRLIQGVAALATSLFATPELRTDSGPSLVFQPVNTFDGEVLTTVSQVLGRHRENWSLLLAADRRLSVASETDDTLLAALFAYAASSLLPSLP